jgi:hypothetical protein
LSDAVLGGLWQDERLMATKSETSEVFAIEAAAEAAGRALAEEGARGLENRCPECGALGSLEPFEDGQVRCVDCDLVVGAATRLGGFGRR